MDVVERLTLEAARADPRLACEHRQRYAFAAGLCAGQRVLDLCCGSGYGAVILAAHAQSVVGVDNDAATVETARVTAAAQTAKLEFELADSVSFLEGEIATRFDVVVCFAGLDRLADLDRALALMLSHTQRGVRMLASVPNRHLLHEDNPDDQAALGYDEARRRFAAFPSVVMIPQFLAEGSLISPPGATQTDIAVTFEDRDEPEYANHFIICAGFDPAQLQDVHHGRIQVSTGPVSNRWAEDLRRSARALRRENARLARARLGKGGSAAATALAALNQREAQIAALSARCQAAEARVAELQVRLEEAGRADQAAADAPAPPRPTAPALDAVEAVSLPLGDDGDPNSWDMRRRRAAEVLIPWIEQTVSLSGRTVLEYGCGNAAVSSAFAQRAAHVIGVDIDGHEIERGREAIRRLGLDNVELECHRPEAIVAEVAGRRGQIDVFLLYAVLEHLTVSERLAVLRLAREVVKPDGAIVVCETPNRLTYFDHHTAQLPFFHLLPDELALESYAGSPREELRAALDAAQAAGHPAALEAIARWGRGVSYHEFEVVFGQRLDQHVLASSYDPILFGERPIHPEEVVLARYLNRTRPDLAPAWSRAWLDVILSPVPVDRREPFLWPWTAETVASSGVAWTGWENLLLKGAQATLTVTLPQPTRRIVVGTVSRDDDWLSLHLAPEESAEGQVAHHRAPAGRHAFTTFALAAPTSRVALSATRECHVVLVAYEA